MLIISFAVSVYAYMKSSKPERKQPVATEKIWQVEVSTVRLQSLSPGLTLYGEVETRSLLKAAAPGAGLVSRVLVSPGDMVQQGQLLVVMDGRDFTAVNLQALAEVTDYEAQLVEHELKYKANQNSLNEEKNLLDLASKEVKRVLRLKKNNLSSESALSAAREMLGKQELSLIGKQLEVDRYPSLRKQLKARLSRARAKLAETELAIERSEVVARFTGVVAEVPLSVGDRANESDVLVSLYPVDSLEVRARIPTRYQLEIQQALETDTVLKASAEISGEELNLRLLRLAGEADPSGIDAYFQVLDNASRLRIGNLVQLDLERPQQDRVVAIPFRSIYGNNRLYIHREGRMEAIDVESVGQYENSDGNNLILVRSPELESGDEIITTHLPNAVDGLKVKVAVEQ